MANNGNIYNLEELVRSHPDPAKLLFRLWEILTALPREDLTCEEVAIVDAWSFDSTYGNGIVSQLDNEQYDEIANGFKALRRIGNHDLQNFVDSIDAQFNNFGIHTENGDAIAKIERLSSDRRGNLEAALKTAEQKFLPKIWHENLIIRAARAYIDVMCARANQ